MKPCLFVCLAAILLAGCREKRTAVATDTDYTQYVDQWIGTGGHGHVFMGANVPFGMVQLGPTSIPQSWDWTSGYHIDDTTVIGFSHTHLSGTGIGDLSDIVLMPVTGEVAFGRGDRNDPASGQWSCFSRASEKAVPGYYATRLDRYGIGVELTATERVGMHRYAFPSGGDAGVIIDLADGQCWDAPLESYIAQTSDSTLVGYRFSKGWADDQWVWFAATFSRPIARLSLGDGEKTVKQTQFRAARVFARVDFDMPQGGELMVKVALSPVSAENAMLNMCTELPGWDFAATVAAAHDKWNAELGKIDIRTGDKSVRRIFYTGLYHTMIAPSLFCDVNGDYRGADKLLHSDEGFTAYTTFSLWDTYRAAHPLMTIIHPQRMPDMIGSLLAIDRQQGRLPVWPLMGCETDCMVGNPAINVISDAILKDFAGFDHHQAWQAMVRTAMGDGRGLDLLKRYGYIPSDLYPESVATCMEYAIADWSLAQVARKMDHEEDYKYFMQRSASYRHYFNPANGFMQGRLADGSFRTPFDPFASTHRADDYTEGNGWQYTWLVPHDVQGLCELFGGGEQLVCKLDSLFVVDGDPGADASPDISGLIGQYAHGNEPSHHVAYLYTMLGEPWKAADRVRQILATMYRDASDGLSGNEDAGQMSAWYVLSALGFYQVEPAGGRYFFGSPIVDEATIDVGDGRRLTITVHNNSPCNRYIQSIRLNGSPHNKGYIDFCDIAAGGRLTLEMGPTPCRWYAEKPVCYGPLKKASMR
ncbi:hypothetical protein FACS1894159_05710 [Bacteroidia bacterium]|nr:hypothetical protein FACS1894159_05710 [Bacteroidia bacterium]